LTLITVQDGPSRHQLQAYTFGLKLAADAEQAINLAGTFFVSEHKDRPWGLLSVPNAMVRGVYQAMNEPGAELPVSGGELDAHISVMRPEEIAQLGGPSKLLNDRGKQFNYTLRRLESVNPAGWDEMSKVWMLRVYSPELQDLRKSYGLTAKPKDNKFDFHITVAVRRKHVLSRGEVSKVSA
jgi:hypothetical protein